MMTQPRKALGPQPSTSHHTRRRTTVPSRSRDNHSVGKRTHTTSDTEEQQLCPQQRYTKRPKHPGMATFDGTLRKLPLQGSKSNHSTIQAEESRHTADSQRIEYSSSDSDTTQAASPPNIYSDLPIGEPFESAAQHVTQELLNRRVESELGVHNLPVGTSTPAIDSSGQLAQTQASLSHVNSTASDSLTDFESLLPYPRSFHLLVESKIVYVQLTTNKVAHGSLMTAAPGSKLSRKLTVWRGLGALRQALAHDSRDFFSISQNPQAPEELRRLAARYSTTTTGMKVDIHEFLRYLHSKSSEHQQQMLSFIDRAKTFLDAFEISLPSRMAWATISDDLHLYLHALIHAGFPGTCVYSCESYHTSQRWEQWKAFQRNSHHTHDDALREWYCNKFLSAIPTAVDEVEELYKGTLLTLSEPVLCLLSGWLCFGPRIARTFQHFVKTFTFLAWFGATS